LSEQQFIQIIIGTFVASVHHAGCLCSAMAVVDSQLKAWLGKCVYSSCRRGVWLDRETIIEEISTVSIAGKSKLIGTLAARRVNLVGFGRVCDRPIWGLVSDGTIA
jgi:hypothetical protein